MWGMCTPVGSQQTTPHICIICLPPYSVWDFTQWYILGTQRVVKNNLECIFHSDARELCFHWDVKLYCICGWNWGLGFLMVFELLMRWLPSKGTSALKHQCELSRSVDPALEGYSSFFIPTFFLFSNCSLSYYLGAPVLCRYWYWAVNVVLVIVQQLASWIIVLTLGICQFQFYKSSHHGWLQAINTVTMNMELGRDTCNVTYSGNKRFCQNCLCGFLRRILLKFPWLLFCIPVDAFWFPVITTFPLRW